MPLKRPAAQSNHFDSSSDDSLSSYPHPRSRAKQVKIAPAESLSEISVYIVQAKLGVSTIAELFALAERHTKAVCKDVQDADVIITAIGMLRRLERHVPAVIARKKAVVTPQWLRDSINHDGMLPCNDYVAVEDLHETTVKHCPDCNCQPCGCSDSSSTSTPVTTPRVECARLPSPAKTPPQRGPIECRQATPFPAHLLSPSPPIATDLEKLTYASHYACQRASPLICPNQNLVRELDIIRQGRALEGEERSALSYQHAAAAIKAFPYEVRSLQQVEKLPFIGVKITGLVEEFIDTGKITEARTIETSIWFQTLSLFSSIYGIGPKTARKLFNLGLRTLDDLEIYYGVDPEEVSAQSQIVEVGEKLRKPEWMRGRDGSAGSDEGLSDDWVRVALGLREDFTKKIQRAEIEEMGRVVMQALDELERGCVSTIAGGYRRGKAESNDVDIVFTHPDASKVKGLCKRLVHKLHEQRMVTHVMHSSGFHSHNPLRTHHWDSLEKALTVFILPRSSLLYAGTRRRLDLIFAPPEVYWTAVIGWTGSIMFQRDIRKWAKDKHSMKFDSSGITRRYDSKEFFPKTEKEAFDLLGLEWVDPTWRNADL